MREITRSEPTRVLVTGGSGFIGTNLVEHLLGRGYAVLSVDKCSPRNPANRSYHCCVDIMDLDRLKKVFAEFSPHAVVHLAARTDLDGASIDDYAENTVGTTNMLNSLRGIDSVSRVLFASSRLVCSIGYVPFDDEDTSATTAYGQSKVEMERRIRGADLPISWTIFRPTSIWGPWFATPYSDFFSTVRRGLYLHPRGQKIFKSFGYVGNSVHQIERLLNADHSIAGKTTYLCDYSPIEVGSWATMIQEAFGAKPIRTVPLAPLRVGGWIGDGLKRIGFRNPPLTSFRLSNLLTPMLHDVSLLKNVAPQLPFGTQEGVARTVNWILREAD
jgi:GlcNAc-P-P-Und epimerase